MKKKLTVCLILTTLLLAAGPVSAQEDPSPDDSVLNEETARERNKVFVTFSYGASASWLTRIIYQTERSNFVFRNFLPGLYFTIEMQNVPYVTPEARITAYYPAVSSFNKMRFKLNTPLHFGIDFYTGVRLETGWGFFKINGGLGLHMLFLSSDRWNYFNLGAAAVAGISFALSPRWTLLIDGFASIDSGNLGANRRMEPFNLTYQFQTSIGVRYSKRMINNSTLFRRRNNSQNTQSAQNSQESQESQDSQIIINR